MVFVVSAATFKGRKVIYTRVIKFSTIFMSFVFCLGMFFFVVLAPLQKRLLNTLILQAHFNECSLSFTCNVCVPHKTENCCWPMIYAPIKSFTVYSDI